MLVCVSPNGGAETRSDEPARRLLVGTITGIAVFERDGEGSRWNLRTLVRRDLQVSALLYLPEQRLVLAGGHGAGGLWISRDLGESFSRIAFPAAHIYSIQCQYRAGGPRLWVGTEPAALFYSDDLGATWTELASLRSVPEHENWTFPPPPHIGHVKGVSWCDADPDRLFVLVEQGGLFVTDNLGKDWRELKGYLIGDQKFYRDSHRLCINPENPDWMIFATGDGLCRSEDGGETWVYVMTRQGRIGYPDCLFIDPYDPDRIIVAGPQSEGAPRIHAKATVMLSRDRGDHFEDVGATMGAPLRGNIEAMAMYATPENALFFAGTATGELFVSYDRCESWECVCADLPPVSKAGHYRWYLTDEERAVIESEMQKWKQEAA